MTKQEIIHINTLILNNEHDCAWTGIILLAYDQSAATLYSA